MNNKLTKKEIEGIEKINIQWSPGKYNQHHINYFDLTEKLGGHGDYTILLVRIEQEWNNKGILYYLFVDHKAWVKIWKLNNKFEIIEEI